MGRFRDAITGLFTTRQHAEANPDTTVRESVRKRIVVQGKQATHYCDYCGALWLHNGFGTTLVSATHGPCCDVPRHRTEIP